jgi:hypothetical protein
MIIAGIIMMVWAYKRNLRVPPETPARVS